jgi:murein DD-endopeptidase MepM/ murein hydrolase activator NlpD
MKTKILNPSILLPSLLAVLFYNSATLPSQAGATRVSQPLDQEPQTRPDEPANWTKLLLETTTRPRLFKGSEGRYHLLYELVATNLTGKDVIIDQIDFVDFSNRKAGNVLSTLSGENLLMMTRAANPNEGNFPVKPGEVRIIFVNLDFNTENDTPPMIAHRIQYHTRKNGKLDQKDLQETILPIATKLKKPIRIAPPLRGTGWLACGGYAASTGHRRALMPIDNKLRCAQRFAIDWIKVDKEGFTTKGDHKNVESAACYGAPVYAVENGEVVAVVSKFENQPVGTASDDIYQPGGNIVVIKHPGEFYSFYAHLKPGSIKIKEGERIKRGQQLAAVGNSGNSDGPHLHMHITDAPGPLSADGIPYIFGKFTRVGRIEDMNAAIGRDTACAKQEIKEINNETCTDALVREGDIVDFGD